MCCGRWCRDIPWNVPTCLVDVVVGTRHGVSLHVQLNVIVVPCHGMALPGISNVIERPSNAKIIHVIPNRTVGK